MSKWKRIEPLKKLNPNPCLHCPDPEIVAPLDMVIAVGFGNAMVTKDGKLIWDEQQAGDHGTYWDVKKAEKVARKDPDHDWRIHKHGPLHGEVYQRHGNNKWVCIEQDGGFA